MHKRTSRILISIRRIAAAILVFSVLLGTCPDALAADSDSTGSTVSSTASGETPSPEENPDSSVTEKTPGSFSEENSSQADTPDTDTLSPDNSGSTTNGFQESSGSSTDTSDESEAGEPATPRERLNQLALENRDTLADEEILIASFLNTSKVLDISQGKTVNGTPVQLYDSHMVSAQRWQVTHDELGYITFTNPGSGKVLDVKNGTAKSGTRIQLYASNGSWAQKWIAVPDGNAVKLISALDESLVLDAANGNSANGTALQLWTDNGSPAQRWVIQSVPQIYGTLDTLARDNLSVLPDGTYVIQSSLGSRKVLDVADGSQKDSANVQIYDSNATAAQKWTVTHDETGYVTFTNTGSGKVLDVAGGLAASGTNVAQFTGNSSRAQKWIVIPAGTDGYRIQSALAPDLCLDIANGSSANKANIQIFHTNETSAQSFHFINTIPQVEPCADLGFGDGWYEMVSYSSPSFTLDIADGSRANGANAQLFSRNGSFAQLFRFSYEDGYYRIICSHSDKVLDVAGGNVVPGTNIRQWTSEAENRNQLFSIIQNEDESYTLINAATGLALDISGGAPASGVNIQAYTPNGTDAQKFSFLKRTNLLNEGLFSIGTSLSSSWWLDVANGSRKEGANIQLWYGNGSTAQKWKVAAVPDAENTYTFESLVSGLLLTADSNGNVCQKAASGTPDQYWIPSISQGYVTLQNAETGNVLDVANASLKNGTNIQTYSPNGTAAQRFHFSSTAPLSSGTYIIRSAADNGYVLDVQDGSRRPGANVQLWASNYSGAQKWKVTVNSDGTCTFTNARSGKLLDVHNSVAASGTNVQQWTQNGNTAQKWRAEYAGNGSFKIVSALDSSFALDIANGSLQNGSNIQLYTDNGTPAQRFTFEQTTYTPEPVNLNVPCLMQYPELPTGCESVALTNTLLYHGFNLSKTTMADQYIPRSSSNFVTAFWGNPHSSSGNCCSAPAITSAANQYLAGHMSPLRAYDVTGTSLPNLLGYLDDGYPVIIWTSIYQAPLGMCYASQWYNGRLYQTFTNSHTVVLKGYDRSKGVVYLSDSISGYLTESMDWINFLYTARGLQAVVIR